MESGAIRPAQDLAVSKDSLRAQFRRCRRQALVAASAGLRAIAAAQLPALLPPGRRLGLYWPVGSEPDLDPWAAGGLAELLREELAAAAVDGRDNTSWEACRRRRGSRLALPAVLPPRPGALQGRLIYLPWEQDASLRPDACGIPAPLPAPGAELQPLPPEALGLLLVPALAVDRSGLRLGSGGGWYDRLRADPAWRSVPALAVLPRACVVDRLPRDPWDVPFSGWLDERGIWPVQPAGA
jgi:5-formyltetrahydrofolate cyclo-ligase